MGPEGWLGQAITAAGADAAGQPGAGPELSRG